MPLVSRIVPDLPERSKAPYDGIKNIGVACLIFKLKSSVTPHFWTNITDDRIAIPGIVEFSNLRPTKETIVFVPYPASNPKWAYSDERLLAEAFGYLKLINPRLTDADLIDMRVGRLRYAQPVCPPGFGAAIPPVRTPIAGLNIADTCSYYPEDADFRARPLWLFDGSRHRRAARMGSAAVVLGEFPRFLSTSCFRPPAVDRFGTQAGSPS
jgi:protoporphyrinogen oxidase